MTETKDNASICFVHLQNTLTQHQLLLTKPERIINGLQCLINHKTTSFTLRIFNTLTGVQIDMDDIDSPPLLSIIENSLRDLHSDSLTATPRETTIENPNEQKIVGLYEWGVHNFFGPLIVSGTIISKDHFETLKLMNIQKCSLKEVKRVQLIASYVKTYCPHSLVVIGNKSYNEFYANVQNSNVIISWCQARVIENISKQSKTDGVLSQPVGNAQLVSIQLRSKGKEVQLIQDPIAEQHISVQASRVLALEVAIQRLELLRHSHGIKMPLGHGKEIRPFIKGFMEKNGKKSLENVAKLHFDIVEGLMDEAFKPEKDTR